MNHWALGSWAAAGIDSSGTKPRFRKHDWRKVIIMLHIFKFRDKRIGGGGTDLGVAAFQNRKVMPQHTSHPAFTVVIRKAQAVLRPSAVAAGGPGHSYTPATHGDLRSWDLCSWPGPERPTKGAWVFLNPSWHRQSLQRIHWHQFPLRV